MSFKTLYEGKQIIILIDEEQQKAGITEIETLIIQLAELNPKNVKSICIACESENGRKSRIEL